MPISKIPGVGLDTGSSGVAPSNLSTGAPSWDGSGNLSFNSGYGSTAVAYGCRAWVNFNGTSTVAIRGSANVSSITDNGTGNYTVNLTTALPDANGAPTLGDSRSRASNNYARGSQVYMASASTAIVFTYDSATSLEDHTDINVAIFR